jgi:ATP-dependent Clp protease adaptor protein ClpS
MRPRSNIITGSLSIDNHKYTECSRSAQQSASEGAEPLVATDLFFWYFETKSTLIPLVGAMQTTPHEQHELEEVVAIQEPAKVILFNDEVHTFDEVIVQLIKAIKCTQTRAEALAWEVHNNGKALVYTGELIKCMEVSHVLEEIELLTQIEV